MFLHKEKAKPPRSWRTARLSVVKNQISTPVIQDTVASPKKVIKALYDYQARSPNELSFARGDFFLVTAKETDVNFYEAFNPITNSRGIVPVACFQVLEKHEKAMVDSAQSNSPKDEVHNHNKAQPLYGIVLYDFQAERSDELDAKAGEPIIIIAQSNAEWYVAKPIGRLGGPGLIPVSFVDIRDASTGRTVNNPAPQASFPNVEDWKKQTLGYEASSIPLNHIEQHMRQVSIEEEQEDDPVNEYYQPDTLLDNYGMMHLANNSSEKEKAIVVSAYIESHILEGDQYWFIVFAKLNNGKHRVLYRLYEDFYDFQVNFLHDFPAEAGKQDQTRILPFMPGPLDAVNDVITADRARDLSTYCGDLLKLPRYLAESPWVQDQLFGIHEGDIETEIDPSISANSVVSSAANPSLTTSTSTTTPTTPKTPKTPMTPVTPLTPNAATSTIKVKIIYKDEIFAIKVPVPSTIEFLKDKIMDRLGFEVQLQYKSGNRLSDLNTETFEAAFNLGKLTVVAS